MAKMTNQNVIKAFFQGELGKIESYTGNLYIINTTISSRLMNYGTVLAERHEGKWLINTTKYSVTTSKIQSYINRELYNQFHPSSIAEHVIYMNDIRINTSYLSLKLEVR
jgi:hypothetical protein